MKERALELLKQAVGENAVFREDQLEAIEAVVSGKKTLVVEKTGWGKSIVYFIATKLLREKSSGMTILISPLLSLMRNQLEAAEKIGLKAFTINSTNIEAWTEIENNILQGNCDLLIISPERLANEEFTKKILHVIDGHGGIGMLVIDEAHCISDWGHDFRPDYKRIVRIVKNLPSSIPVLATTATANNRVVKDIKEQLGEDLTIIRGPLTRESLKIQVIKLDHQSERLAWLSENIPLMPGSGIVYCLTKSDCDKVAQWLRSKGINALEYHTSVGVGKEQRILEEDRENMLMNNEVKVLVSTIKIGMGYDKPDLGFVVHYQSPGSIVAYYQQIGRAGRKLETAYTVLLSGKEDEAIQTYFIDSAFPTDFEIKKVLAVIENSDSGAGNSHLYEELNLSPGRISNCLKMLLIDQVITKEGSFYYRTTKAWYPNDEKSKQVTAQRYNELDKMKEFIDLKTCYMKFIAEELDDPSKADCGRCSNCEEKLFFKETLDDKEVIEAEEFLKGEYIALKPRKQWPEGVLGHSRKAISKNLQNEEGRVLCHYSDAGWGRIVQEDRADHLHFREELVVAAVDVIKNHWEKAEEPTWVTSIPSLRKPELVKSLAQRIAKALDLPYREALVKKENTGEQKNLNNSYQQAMNSKKGFGMTIENIEDEPVLLIDDLVDSKWTVTICGELLRSHGSGKVYPFVLASTAQGGLG